MSALKHAIWPIARFYDPGELSLAHRHVRDRFQHRQLATPIGIDRRLVLGIDYAVREAVRVCVRLETVLTHMCATHISQGQEWVGVGRRGSRGVKGRYVCQWDLGVQSTSSAGGALSVDLRDGVPRRGPVRCKALISGPESPNETGLYALLYQQRSQHTRAGVEVEVARVLHRDLNRGGQHDQGVAQQENEGGAEHCNKKSKWLAFLGLHLLNSLMCYT